MSDTQTAGCGCSSRAPMVQAPATPGDLAFVAGAHDISAGEARRALAGPLGTFQGRILTEAFARSGYATDPDALRAYYDTHEAAVDGYLAYLDAEAVAEDILSSYGTPAFERAAQKADVASFAAGALTGIAAVLLIQKMRGRR